MEQKDPTSFLSCVLWSLQLEPPSTCFQNKKKKQRLWGALNRDSLIKQFFFFLQVFPRSEGKVPRVPVSTLNDTPAAQLSREPLFTKHGEQRRKTKNTFRLSSPASLIFDAPMVQTCFVSTPFVAPRKWKCEEKRRKMRQPTVEREGGWRGKGGLTEGAGTGERWGHFHTNSWRKEVEHLVNVPSAV